MKIPFALSNGGAQVAADLGELSVLVGGLPGTGKSSTLRAMIAGLAYESAALVLVDPKRVELPRWSPRASLVAVEPDDATAALRAVCELVDARYRHLEDVGAVRWTETPVVVVVDELAELLDTGDPGDKDRARLLRRILSKGRAAGVGVVAATQRPSADVVPTFVRDLFAFRVCHATSTREATEMILGPAYAAGPAHELPLGEAGAGLAYALLEGERRPALIRSMWLEPARVDGIARETAHLRPHLELTPSLADVPPVAAWSQPSPDDALLAALADGPKDYGTVAAEVGMTADACRRRLARLEADGKVRHASGSRVWEVAA